MRLECHTGRTFQALDYFVHQNHTWAAYLASAVSDSDMTACDRTVCFKNVYPANAQYRRWELRFSVRTDRIHFLIHLYGELRSSGVIGRHNGPSGLRDDDDDQFLGLMSLQLTEISLVLLGLVFGDSCVYLGC